MELCSFCVFLLTLKAFRGFDGGELVVESMLTLHTCEFERGKLFCESVLGLNICELDSDGSQTDTILELRSALEREMLCQWCRENY